MTNLIYVPIEPLTERYSEQWYRRMPLEFSKSGFQVTTIDGSPLINNDIKVGTFLDINSTCHYKWSQLQEISRMFHENRISDGTVFFFADIEFWGLEAIRLLASMNNVKVYLTGFLHAGSYTKEDAFEIAAPYQQFTEVGWVAALDKVFVGSEYHKRTFYAKRLVPLGMNVLDGRIIVTKNPIFVEEYPYTPGQKKKKVLLTNRFDIEKRPDETLNLFSRLKARFPNWEFVVTTGRKEFRSNCNSLVYLAKSLEEQGVIQIRAGLTKEQYHAELADSYIMVSHSIEENYGYCIAESLLFNCIPLLKEVASHPEFVGPDLLFNNQKIPDDDYTHMVALMRDFSPHPKNLRSGLDISGMQNIIDQLREFQ